MWNMLFGIKGRKAKCQICKKESELVSDTLKICLSCIRNKPEKVQVFTNQIHKQIREEFKLPGEPPRDEKGLKLFNFSLSIPINNYIKFRHE
jgi:pyruvate formate lyase activating enzyme